MVLIIFTRIFEINLNYYKDLKYQMSFISDPYTFDFEHFGNTLKEMKELQNQILEQRKL